MFPDPLPLNGHSLLNNDTYNILLMNKAVITIIQKGQLYTLHDKLLARAEPIFMHYVSGSSDSLL